MNWIQFDFLDDWGFRLCQYTFPTRWCIDVNDARSIIYFVHLSCVVYEPMLQVVKQSLHLCLNKDVFYLCVLFKNFYNVYGGHDDLVILPSNCEAVSLTEVS